MFVVASLYFTAGGLAVGLRNNQCVFVSETGFACGWTEYSESAQNMKGSICAGDAVSSLDAETRVAGSGP